MKWYQDQIADDEDDDDPGEHSTTLSSTQGASETSLLLPRGGDGHKNFTKEGTWPFVRKILVETVPTLLLTIIGLTLTGELLEHGIAQWRPLKEVDELYILIPMLNNLKGNLEMSLSSRLSTSAVLGELDIASTRKMIVYGTMCLLQVQALVVSAVAAILSFLLGRVITHGKIPVGDAPSTFRAAIPPFRTPPLRSDKPQSGLREFTMVLCTAMASASFSGLILSSFMCFLIITCRRFGRNPDNIAPPMASCLGDLLTLSTLGLVSSVLIRIMNTMLPFALIFILSLGAVFAVVLTLRNNHVRKLIASGWIPLFGAMVISSGTGLVLEHFVTQYEGFGLLAVAISGLPDAVGCVFVSRISTSLHVSAASSSSDESSAHDPRILTTIITLLVVTLPVQIIYVTFLHVTGWLSLPWLFVALFVFIFCCAVLVALVIANILTHFLWRRGLDPDTYAMPIQSSLVDLSGQLLLVVCYEIARSLGADVQHKHWK